MLENDSRFLWKNDAIFALDVFKRSWDENKKIQIDGEYYKVTEKVVHEFYALHGRAISILFENSLGFGKLKNQIHFL